MDAETPQAAPAPLEYGPPPPAWRRRRVWRWSVALAMLVVLVFAAERIYPDVRRRAEFVARQRAVMNFRHPPGTAIFTQTPDQTHATRPRPGEAALRADQFTPALWQQFIARDVTGPGPAVNGMPQYFQSHGTIFLHRRTRGDGVERLVALDLSITWTAQSGVMLDAYVRVIEPGTFFRLWATERRVANRADGVMVDHLENYEGARFDLINVPWGSDFRLFAAEPDPDDRAHFTIPYTLDGVAGTIDGWLRTDDAVVLKLRKPPPPATMPS